MPKEQKFPAPFTQILHCSATVVIFPYIQYNTQICLSAYKVHSLGILNDIRTHIVTGKKLKQFTMLRNSTSIYCMQKAKVKLPFVEKPLVPARNQTVTIQPVPIMTELVWFTFVECTENNWK
jgi:hypothetical protein